MFAVVTEIFGRDTYIEEFETLEKANKQALTDWLHTTKRERKGRRVNVFEIVGYEKDEYDGEDDKGYPIFEECEGAFNSENEKE